jgi:hypothetical protein
VLGQATGNTGTQDSPRPGLGGSHHLPPYSILCSSQRRWHPNGYFSRDSWVGVSKLSRARVLELWTPISLDYRVWLRHGLKQSYSSRRDLSNTVLHFQIAHREEVDSWLLVVGSQTASLTPGLSFGHNLSYRCPDEQCEPILDIYVPRAFQWYQERNNPLRFDPSTRPLKFQESTETPSPKMGVALGVNTHTPSHFLKLQGVCGDSRAFSWPAPFQCLCFRSWASFLLACNLAMLLPWLSSFLPLGLQPCNPLPCSRAQI